MKSKWFIALIIPIIIFVLLFLASVLFKSGIDFAFIGTTGFLVGLIVLIASLSFTKIIQFGTRASQAEWIFPDEHLVDKVQKQYGKKEKLHSSDQFLIAGIIIIVVSIFFIL
jgi:hypothetical protein